MSSMYYRSYEPPKRDEETEMLRKKRAKRARETRRSTQVSTLPLSQISGIVEGHCSTNILRICLHK